MAAVLIVSRQIPAMARSSDMAQGIATEQRKDNRPERAIAVSWGTRRQRGPHQLDQAWASDDKFKAKDLLSQARNRPSLDLNSGRLRAITGRKEGPNPSQWQSQGQRHLDQNQV